MEEEGKAVRDTMWMYLPAIARVRQIVPVETYQRFLDTDFSYRLWKTLLFKQVMVVNDIPTPLVMEMRDVQHNKYPYDFPYGYCALY